MAGKPKLTKQGVRDLNDLPAKSRGRVLPEPPVPVACKHKKTRQVNFFGVSWIICENCDMTLQEW